mgnify:CR=1 FL=1
MLKSTSAEPKLTVLVEGEVDLSARRGSLGMENGDGKPEYSVLERRDGELGRERAPLSWEGCPWKVLSMPAEAGPETRGTADKLRRGGARRADGFLRFIASDREEKTIISARRLRGWASRALCWECGCPSNLRCHKVCCFSCEGLPSSDLDDCADRLCMRDG